MAKKGKLSRADPIDELEWSGPTESVEEFKSRGEVTVCVSGKAENHSYKKYKAMGKFKHWEGLSGWKAYIPVKNKKSKSHVLRKKRR